MLKNIYLLTIIPNPDRYTVYFLRKKELIILPVTIPYKGVDIILSTNEMCKDHDPDLFNTTKRIIGSLGARITGIKIYMYKENTFYTYICIENRGKEYDINSDFADALILAIRCNTTILVEEKVLNECGIKVTKELLERSLI